MLDLSDQHAPRVSAALPTQPADTAEPSPVQEGQWYRHYKGRIYSVVGLGVLESSSEPLVLYTSVDPLERHAQWARPLPDFLGTVQPGGVPRFARLRNAQDSSALEYFLSPFSGLKDVVSEILQRYDEPWRHFHSRWHLHDIFRVARDFNLELLPEQVFALLFHDAVFLPGAPDGQNERQSILLAQSYKARLGAACLDWQTINRLIEETATGHPSCDLSATVLDLDRASLGDDAVHFCAADERVWLENRHLLSTQEPRKDFDTRRLRYLLGQASRGPLFFGPLTSLEEQARSNLEGLRLAWIRNYGNQPQS